MQALIHKFTQFEDWQRNLVILWFGCFMTGIGGSLIAPFLALYIDTLGNFTKTQLNFQSGLIYASTYLMTAIVSPLWGKLADKKGRKLMLLRASAGMAVTIFLMGFVTAAWQLLVLRMLLGAFSGFVSNATALMAIITPKAHSGSVLGTLSTSTVSGTLLGPLIGGVLVNHGQYRRIFWMTGIIMFLVFWLALFFVKEKFELSDRPKHTGLKAVGAMISQPRIIIGMVLTTMMIQMTDKSISPILSLYVRELVKNPHLVTIFSGVVASAPGIVMLFFAPLFGRIGDKIGQYKILLLGLCLSFLLYFTLGFTTAIWQVILLRLLVGISDSALAPSVQIILAKNTPHSVTGQIFSYNQTMQSVGSVVGPLVGSAVASFLDYRFIFFFAAVCIVINLVNYFTNFKRLRAQEDRPI